MATAIQRRTIAMTVIVVGAVLFVIVWSRREREAELIAATQPAGSGSGAVAPVAGSGSAAAPNQKFRKIDKPRRDAILDRIKTSRAARESGGASSSSPSTPRPELLPGTLTADDIRKGVRDLIPLLAECYDAALPRLQVKAGKITVRMRFIGEPDTGTLIDTADVDGGEFKADAELMECFQQTMLSIELPPTTAGEVFVTYPIAFAPGD